MRFFAINGNEDINEKISSIFRENGLNSRFQLIGDDHNGFKIHVTDPSEVTLAKRKKLNREILKLSIESKKDIYLSYIPLEFVTPQPNALAPAPIYPCG